MKRLKKGALINILILILIIIVILYTLLNSKIFNSNQIRIEGNEKISKDYIVRILDLREDKNIFMYNLKDMEKELEENKYIEDVRVKREFPNKLHIIIIEKEISGIIQDDGLKCYIDNKGKFIDKVKKDEEIDNYLMIDIGYKLDKNNNIKFKKKDIKIIYWKY
ncbi:cell division protein FtsQ/DivIB [Romboutsia hominis]|uniref:cell division protein FtsQ/DivIB n=1 Tax=Romboutsia hominis TaxID=1507512 RepID=UPI001F070F08|nr:FtsQ-type POTRA domain-containing protein [Romboutsia hominis]MCH1968504.1 FtsQ-type POTRA domain-containing protein [Romboutsia hominis]